MAVLVLSSRRARSVGLLPFPEKNGPGVLAPIHDKASPSCVFESIKQGRIAPAQMNENSYLTLVMRHRQQEDRQAQLLLCELRTTGCHTQSLHWHMSWHEEHYRTCNFISSPYAPFQERHEPTGQNSRELELPGSEAILRSDESRRLILESIPRPKLADLLSTWKPSMREITSPQSWIGLPRQ